MNGERTETDGSVEGSRNFIILFLLATRQKPPLSLDSTAHNRARVDGRVSRRLSRCLYRYGQWTGRHCSLPSLPSRHLRFYVASSSSLEEECHGMNGFRERMFSTRPGWGLAIGRRLPPFRRISARISGVEMGRIQHLRVGP